MGYRSLGARQATAAPDTTGNNTGNLTTVFDPKALGISVSEFEIYRGVVQNATAGCSATLSINNYPTSCNIFGSTAEWDPTQPPLMGPGDSLFIYWSLAVGSTKPVTTLWFRYDDSVAVTQ